MSHIWKQISFGFLYMIGMSMVFFTLSIVITRFRKGLSSPIALIASFLGNRKKDYKRLDTKDVIDGDDEDVQVERANIFSRNYPDDSPLVIDNLSKTFRGANG